MTCSALRRITGLSGWKVGAPAEIWISAEHRVSSLRTSRTGLSRHAGQSGPGLGARCGVSGGVAAGRAGACRDVESPAGHHGCRCREAPGQRGRPQLRGVPVLGARAAGPVPGGRGGAVRAAVPSAENLAERDQRRGRRPDRRGAQGAAGQGLDTGPDTIAWHPRHRHKIRVCLRYGDVESSSGERVACGPGLSSSPMDVSVSFLSSFFASSFLNKTAHTLSRKGARMPAAMPKKIPARNVLRLAARAPLTSVTMRLGLRPEAPLQVNASPAACPGFPFSLLTCAAGNIDSTWYPVRFTSLRTSRVCRNVGILYSLNFVPASAPM